MNMNKLIKNTILFSIFTLAITSCKEDKNTSDAFGNFDVNETIISAEAAGRLETFTIKEGQLLKVGQVIGSIDSTSLVLQRNEIKANKKTITAKLTAINAEIKVLKVQLSVIEKEHVRVLKLIESDVATQKQKDDIEGNIKIIKSKINAANAQKPAVTAQLTVIDANLAKVDYLISKCIIINPIGGRVLTKLVEPYEIVGLGKPLYKIANTDKIYLKAFVTGTQVSGLKIGQKVAIIIDTPEGDYRSINGIINWISDEAEFTPKLIQTREERVSLVYAIKVGFENNAQLPSGQETVKIGMPGEVKF